MTIPAFHPLISIIIPVYNRETLLPDTLDSLAAQTGRPMEVVLVDNGSTDASGNLCEAFKTRMNKPDFQVQVLHEPQIGANKARNAGFQVSRGQYVWFFDSDDKLLHDSVARVIEALQRAESPELIAFPFGIRDRNDGLQRRPHRFSVNPAAHLIDPVLSTHNMCLKRELVESTGGWHPDLARWQDFEFGFRVLLKAKTACWLEGLPFYEVRDHAASISGKGFTEDLVHLENSLNCIKQRIDGVEDEGLKASLLRGYGYKWASLAGLVRREGHAEESQRLLQTAIDSLSTHFGHQTIKRSTLAKGLYRFCAWYVGAGGRGLWRLADKLL